MLWHTRPLGSGAVADHFSVVTGKPAKKKEPKPKVEEPKPKSEEDEALDSFEKDINAAFGISDDDDE